jgi:dTMP kinase
VTLPSDPARPGWFITIEGPDGSGKTSQAARLEARAVAAGIDVVLSREPGGTRAGEAIREILLARAGAAFPHDVRTDALLFSAARAQHVVEVIRPALARGALVVSTRYLDSTLAYQGYGGGLPIDELRALQAFATGGLRPHLTLLLDLPAEVGLRRKAGDEVTRFEAEFDLAFHRRVRAGFLELAAAEPSRFVVIDATATEDVVSAAILAAAAPLPGLENLAVSTQPNAAG